jgi:hypothetical protein
MLKLAKNSSELEQRSQNCVEYVLEGGMSVFTLKEILVAGCLIRVSLSN